jgi:hypothetical protein
LCPFTQIERELAADTAREQAGVPFDEGQA